MVEFFDLKGLLWRMTIAAGPDRPVLRHLASVPIGVTAGTSQVHTGKLNWRGVRRPRMTVRTSGLGMPAAQRELGAAVVESRVVQETAGVVTAIAGAGLAVLLKLPAVDVAVAAGAIHGQLAQLGHAMAAGADGSGAFLGRRMADRASGDSVRTFKLKASFCVLRDAELGRRESVDRVAGVAFVALGYRGEGTAVRVGMAVRAAIAVATQVFCRVARAGLVAVGARHPGVLAKEGKARAGMAPRRIDQQAELEKPVTLFAVLAKAPRVGIAMAAGTARFQGGLHGPRHALAGRCGGLMAFFARCLGMAPQQRQARAAV